MGRFFLRSLQCWSIFIAGTAGLAGCGPYPRDIERTTQHIASSRTIRAGIVVEPLSRPDRVAVDRFLTAVEQRIGAHVIRSSNGAEALMQELNHAQLDLVIGPFSDDTPWRNEVAVSEPLRQDQATQKTPVVRAVIRNGENRWIMTVEQVIRDQAGGA